MIFTKEEFESVVKRFNEDKEKYGWSKYLNINVRKKWEVFTQEIEGYPSYYNFDCAREFKYWLTNSENENFIEERFCPVCGKFIEVQSCGFQGHYKVSCEEHAKEVRMQHVEDGVLRIYGERTIGKVAEIQERRHQTNLKTYGVSYPLQSKKIHEKTIESGLAKGSYLVGSQKGRETKKELYGDENYNNAAQISETKRNQPEEVKKEIDRKRRETNKALYGDENYCNHEQAVATMLERYGVENTSQLPEVKKRMKESEKRSRMNNHTTHQELISSTEPKYNGLTYKENFVTKTKQTKEQNGTTAEQLFSSDKIYKDGLTYKENFVQKCKLTREKNHTTASELYNSTEILENGLTYKESFNKKSYETKKKNGTMSSSKPEEILGQMLKNRYGNVKEQYRSELYPYACDYYLPDCDVYIEFQGFPSHGGHPFNPNDQDDLKRVEEWKQKANETSWDGRTKKLYKIFIEVWTQSDPEKRECAKRNRLNFLEIFPQNFDYDLDAIMEYIWNFTLQLNVSGLS